MRTDWRGGCTRRVLHAGVIGGSLLEDTNDGIGAPFSSLPDQNHLHVAVHSQPSAAEVVLLFQ